MKLLIEEQNQEPPHYTIHYTKADGEGLAEHFDHYSDAIFRAVEIGRHTLLAPDTTIDIVRYSVVTKVTTLD